MENSKLSLQPADPAPQDQSKHAPCDQPTVIKVVYKLKEKDDVAESVLQIQDKDAPSDSSKTKETLDKLEVEKPQVPIPQDQNKDAPSTTVMNKLEEQLMKILEEAQCTDNTTVIEVMDQLKEKVMNKMEKKEELLENIPAAMDKLEDKEELHEEVPAVMEEEEKRLAVQAPPPPIHPVIQPVKPVNLQQQYSITSNTKSNDPDTICPYCNALIKIRSEQHASGKTYLAGALLCIFLCWPCVCLPCCCKYRYDTLQFCPNCNAFLGKYQKIFPTFPSDIINNIREEYKEFSKFN